MSFLLSSNLSKKSQSKFYPCISFLTLATFLLSGCADALGPDARNVNIPSPKLATERKIAINEGGESIIYLPLGEDVLLPQAKQTDPLPDTVVGPFELRGETLAGALQLIMDGIDIPVAFESSSSLTETITVTNLKGPVSKIVNDVCSLSNMYCSYQGGVLVVKDREIFSVTVPPIVPSAEVAPLLTNISAAIGAITGEAPISDPSTRTIVYRASQRTAEMATRYFQRLRSNTAMIVYETYIWEVGLESGNTTGIKWDRLSTAGDLGFGININGSANSNLGSPISIGLPTTGTVNFSTKDVFQFISSYGAVKTISQPQISVLSGSSAKLRVADKENYVASVTKTASTTAGGADTFTTTTASADTGFTLSIGSNWDNSTVYGTIAILLQEVKSIEEFTSGPDATVQLPQTTERELNTSVRVRPGDMVLIAGLVKENDNFTKEGLGLQNPTLPTSRSVSTGNTELVFLLRPRVVVFTSPTTTTPRVGQIDKVVLPDQEMLRLAPLSMNVGELDSLDSEVESPPVLKEDNKSSSIEIQPLESVLSKQQTKKTELGDPSVIVNYDVLGK
jgi:MSHA biogenesis protein MshL